MLSSVEYVINSGSIVSAVFLLAFAFGFLYRVIHL